MTNAAIRYVLSASICLGLLAVASLAPARAAKPAPKEDPVWVLAYYLSGNQDNGLLPPEDIDFKALSHLIHFGIFPKADGTLDPVKGMIPAEQSKKVIELAHAAGRKVLVSVGTNGDLMKAYTDPVRPVLVKSLVDFVVSRGYDGLDLDDEPLEDAAAPNYEKLINDLYPALKAANPNLLLTAAVASQPAMFARLQSEFDRIDLMTYDLSGPWPGFVSWYNAGLYDGGQKFPTENKPLPSCDGMAQDYVKAGVAKAKLGIGIAFYGYHWTGVSGPLQSITGVKVNDDVEYRDIMDQYFKPERYHWDAKAVAPYLSVESTDPTQRWFLSYDDERLCGEKLKYVRKQGLGGVIIWELGGGYRKSEPAGKRDVLLQAIKRAWRERR